MVEFNRVVLDNGLTIIHEKRDVSVTTVMMAVKFGAMFEESKEKGIAHFMEHLCFKGTEKRDAKEIAESLESVGGDLNAFTHEEMTAYHVRLPSNYLKLGIDVISDIFFNANFPEEEIKKEANVIVEEIKMYRDNPRAYVFDKIKNNLYKEPFGEFIAGSPETVMSISREQIIKKHRELYIPQNSILCVVGNNDFNEVVEFAKRYASQKKEGIKILDNLDVLKKIKKDSESRGDVMQSNLAIGFHFPKLSSKERYSALVFSSILGEGMSSKLFREVREKRGLVYSVKSELDLGRNYGYMLIWAGTDQSKVKEVINICCEEFEKIGEIDSEELEKAKIQVIGNHLVESEASNQTAVQLIMEEFVRKAEDYYDFEKKINSVKIEDIKRLAQTKEYSIFSLGPKN
jgi:predicted Zn-dependent peptidase